MPWNRIPPRELLLCNLQNYQDMGKFENEDESKMVCDHGREVCMVCPVDHRSGNMMYQGMEIDKANMINQEQQNREDCAMNLLSGSRYIQAGCKEAQSLFDDALKHIEKEQANKTKQKPKCKPVEYKPPVYSMPDKERNKKSCKKISERYITRCIQCKSKILSERNAHKCKCLEFWYCTQECQQKKYHMCREKSLEKGEYMEKIKNHMTKETYAIFVANLMFYKENGITREMLKGDAERGDVTAAWMVGIGNQFGIVSNDNCPIARNPNAKDKGKVAGESKAMKWFKKAAEGGHPQAMSDLGQMLLDSDDLRTGYDWIDMAREAGCNDHYHQIVENCLLRNEVKVTLDSLLENLKQDIIRDGSGVTVQSPNLGTMLISYRLQFLQNNNWKCSNGVPVINAPVLQKLYNVIEARSLDVEFIPGRGGSTNEVTLQMLNLAPRRCPENIVYRFGNVKKDDGPLVDFYQRNNLRTDDSIIGKLENGTNIMQTCSHSNEIPIYCGSCVIMGKYRVFAVAHDLYAISTTYAIIGYGYQVTYANSLDNTIIKETFKSYSKPEIKSVLSCLMNNPADVHVYHMAQDPNLYWPIVWYYGSVHAALERVGGQQLIRDVYHSNEIKTAERNKREDIDENLAAAFPEMPGNLGLICGNEECVKFGLLESFSKCGSCKNRRYCSEKCQRADWKIHKQECIKKEKNSGELEKKQSVKKAHVSQKQKAESVGTREEETEEIVKEDKRENHPKWKPQQKRKQKNKRKF